MPLDLLVRRLAEQRTGRGVAAPLPQSSTCGVAQRHAVEVQKAWAIRRIEAQVRDTSIACGNAEAHGLAFCANDTRGAELAIFGVSVTAIDVQLCREQRVRLRWWLARIGDHFVRQGLGHRRGAADELVGERVTRREQVARHGGRQFVELRLEFRLGHLAANRVHRLNFPGVVAQKASERLSREKAQVGAVEQAFFAIAEVALHELGDQTGIARVGHGKQQLARGLEQIPALAQHVVRAAQVFQNVGADDVVVLLGGKQLQQIGGVQIGHHHLAVGPAGEFGFGFAPGQSVDRTVACFPEVGTKRATAAAQIEHGGSIVYQAGEHRE